MLTQKGSFVAARELDNPSLEKHYKTISDTHWEENKQESESRLLRWCLCFKSFLFSVHIHVYAQYIRNLKRPSHKHTHLEIGKQEAFGRR